MYAGALCSGPAIKSRLAYEQAGPTAGSVEASLCAAPTQGGAWSTARSPAGGLTTSSEVQPDSQGAPSSLAGAVGPLPQSWESGAGWAGAAARQTQTPDPISSHAISTAVTGLVRTRFSIGHFSRSSSAAAESEGGTDRSPSFIRFGEPAVNRGHTAQFLGGITPANSPLEGRDARECRPERASLSARLHKARAERAENA